MADSRFLFERMRRRSLKKRGLPPRSFLGPSKDASINIIKHALQLSIRQAQMSVQYVQDEDAIHCALAQRTPDLLLHFSGSNSTRYCNRKSLRRLVQFVDAMQVFSNRLWNLKNVSTQHIKTLINCLSAVMFDVITQGANALMPLINIRLQKSGQSKCTLQSLFSPTALFIQRNMQRKERGKERADCRPSLPINCATVAEQPALTDSVNNPHYLIPPWTGRHSAMEANHA